MPTYYSLFAGAARRDWVRRGIIREAALYEASSKTESTDAAGTKVVEKTSDEKSKTLTGKAKLSHSSETTTDPKGLGNKTVAKSETVTKHHPDGSVTTEVK